MDAIPLMHESWGAWPWFAPLWILLWIVVIATVIRSSLAPARRLVVRAAVRRGRVRSRDPGRTVRPGRDRRHRVPVQAGPPSSVGWTR